MTLALVTQLDMGIAQLVLASKALFLIVAANTSGVAKNIVKEEFKNRSGMVAWVRLRERFSNATGAWCDTETFKVQWSATLARRPQEGLVANNRQAAEEHVKHCNGGLVHRRHKSLWRRTFVSRFRKTPATWWAQCGSPPAKTMRSPDDMHVSLERRDDKDECTVWGTTGREKSKCRFASYKCRTCGKMTSRGRVHEWRQVERKQRKHEQSWCKVIQSTETK